MSSTRTPCPECSCLSSKVMRTWPTDDFQIFRRRRCLNCDHVWATIQPQEDILPPNYKVSFHRNNQSICEHVTLTRTA